MTKKEEAQLFRLLNEVSRLHRCFIAELFVSSEGKEYTICFRPSEESADRYACVYFHLPLSEAQQIVRLGIVTPQLAGELREKLGPIGG